MDNITGDRWLEIDTDAIKNNLDQIAARLDESVRLIAVLKADAYGHGAVETARILYQNGVDFFAVSFLEEALVLRRAGIRASIMLLSPLVDEKQVTLALENRITITLTSPGEAQMLDGLCRLMDTKATVHLKADTGLGRFGMKLEELLQVGAILKANPAIYLEGLYTHMATAADSVYTRRQFEEFTGIVDGLNQAGFRIPVCHCANSAVFLKYPEMHLNAVRIGTLLAGEVPVGAFKTDLALTNPYKYKTRIISVRTLPQGSYLGYYRTSRLRQEAQIAVIPVGYTHGLGLEVANRPAGFIDLMKILAKKTLAWGNRARFQTQVTINGHSYPIRGKIFMQLALVEIPVKHQVNIGDEVEVPVRKTLLRKDLSRVYIKDGVPCKLAEEERITYIVEGDN